MDRYLFDRQYLERLIAGDRATEDHFVQYFGEMLRVKLRARLHSGQAVDDLRQETLLRVFQSLRRDGLEHPERLGGFVNSVANNVLFEHYRSEKKSAAVPEDYPEPVDPTPDAESDFVTSERSEQVRKVLSEMSKKDQQILRAIFWEERDKDQICRECGVDRNYLRVLLYRACQRMRKGVTKAALVTGAKVLLICLC